MIFGISGVKSDKIQTFLGKYAIIDKGDLGKVCFLKLSDTKESAKELFKSYLSSMLDYIKMATVKGLLIQHRFLPRFLDHD